MHGHVLIVAVALVEGFIWQPTNAQRFGNVYDYPQVASLGLVPARRQVQYPIWYHLNQKTPQLLQNAKLQYLLSQRGQAQGGKLFQGNLNSRQYDQGNFITNYYRQMGFSGGNIASGGQYGIVTKYNANKGYQAHEPQYRGPNVQLYENNVKYLTQNGKGMINNLMSDAKTVQESNILSKSEDSQQHDIQKGLQAYSAMLGRRHTNSGKHQSSFAIKLNNQKQDPGKYEHFNHVSSKSSPEAGHNVRVYFYNSASEDVPKQYKSEQLTGIKTLLQNSKGNIQNEEPINDATLMAKTTEGEHSSNERRQQAFKSFPNTLLQLVYNNQKATKGENNMIMTDGNNYINNKKNKELSYTVHDTDTSPDEINLAFKDTDSQNYVPYFAAKNAIDNNGNSKINEKGNKNSVLDVITEGADVKNYVLNLLADKESSGQDKQNIASLANNNNYALNQDGTTVVVNSKYDYDKQNKIKPEIKEAKTKVADDINDVLNVITKKIDDVYKENNIPYENGNVKNMDLNGKLNKNYDHQNFMPVKGNTQKGKFNFITKDVDHSNDNFNILTENDDNVTAKYADNHGNTDAAKELIPLFSLMNNADRKKDVTTENNISKVNIDGPKFNNKDNRKIFNDNNAQSELYYLTPGRQVFDEELTDPKSGEANFDFKPMSISKAKFAPFSDIQYAINSPSEPVSKLFSESGLERKPNSEPQESISEFRPPTFTTYESSKIPHPVNKKISPISEEEECESSNGNLNEVIDLLKNNNIKLVSLEDLRDVFKIVTMYSLYKEYLNIGGDLAVLNPLKTALRYKIDLLRKKHNADVDPTDNERKNVDGKWEIVKVLVEYLLGNKELKSLPKDFVNSMIGSIISNVYSNSSYSMSACERLSLDVLLKDVRRALQNYEHSNQCQYVNHGSNMNIYTVPAIAPDLT